MVLWVTVCPERAAGTEAAAAATYVTAASGGLLLRLACFSLSQSPFLALFRTPDEELVVVEGAAGNSQVCSKEQVWVWEFGDCSQTELPSTLASKGRHVLRSTPVQTIPLPDQLLCQPAVMFNVLPR